MSESDVFAAAFEHAESPSAFLVRIESLQAQVVVLREIRDELKKLNALLALERRGEDASE